MSLPKLEKEMWCYHCETIWTTDDYHNCVECPSCKAQPAHMYRTDSFGYIYAYRSKHPDQFKMMKEMKTLTLFPNGMASGWAPDNDQEPLPLKGWLEVYFDYLETLSYEPEKIPEIYARMNDGKFHRIKPFRTTDGLWNYHIEEIT